MPIKFAPLVPELYVRNLTSSLHFYIDLLEFRILYKRPEEGFAFLELNGAQMMLEQIDALEAADKSEFARGQWRTGTLEYPFGRGINFEITVSNLEALLMRLLGAEYPLTLPVEERWYRVGKQLVGSRRFLVMDPDGYLLRFSENADEQSGREAE